MDKNLWSAEKPIDLRLKVILFIISPFLSFLYSLRSMNTKSSYCIFFLFALVFGMCFSITNVRMEGIDDGASYRAEFEYMQYKTKDQYVRDFSKFLSFDEGKKDFYFDTMAFGISRFTSNYHIFFMFIALVFSYFMLRCFRFFTSDKNYIGSFSCLLLAFLFTFNQIYNINGLRFWTAAWIGVYCILQIVKNDRKWYYLLLLVTPFFHGAFWFFIGVFLLVQLTKRFEKVWIVMFFLSFIFSSVAVDLFAQSAEFLPEFLASLVRSYTSEDTIEERFAEGTGWWWLGNLFNISVKLYINIMAVLFIINAKKIKIDTRIKALYLFLIPYMAIMNFVMSIPSLGARYIRLSYPIIAYIWLVTFSNKKYNYFLYMLPFVFFMNIYSYINKYLSVLNLDFFVSSPIYLVFKYLL